MRPDPTRPAPPDRPAQPARTRRTVAATLAGTLGLACLAAASTAAAHDGEHSYDSTYTPPPVVEPGRPTGAFTQVPRPQSHEVWLVDQSDTRTDGDAAANGFAAYGGRIHVYDGGELRTAAGSAAAEVVDLGGATAELCRAQTGANPVRPHMLYFNSDHSHAVLAFVASGHTVFYEADTREPVACFRSEASPTGRQAHASVPTPDDRYVIVANQNGKKLERIRTDYEAGVFVAEPEATLDLADGLTPNGVPLQTPGDPLVRPDTAPICPFVPSTGFPAYISLRGGGMLAVDPYATPLAVVAEYPATEIARDGCGFTEAKGWVYGNGGSNPGNLSGWFHYRLPVGDRDDYSADNPPSTPAVELVDRDTRGPRDAHGVVTVRDKYVWAFDRAAHVVQVYRADDASDVTTVNLRTAASQAPAPDIVAAAPDGAAVYAATRGPNPLSGTHAATGDAPGLMVLEVRKDGRDAAVRGLAPVSNVVSGVERADPHGIAVRPLG
jgi:hypothetical protein